MVRQVVRNAPHAKCVHARYARHARTKTAGQALFLESHPYRLDSLCVRGRAVSTRVPASCAASAQTAPGRLLRAVSPWMESYRGGNTMGEVSCEGAT
jgi:hypothetical protein